MCDADCNFDDEHMELFIRFLKANELPQLRIIDLSRRDERSLRRRQLADREGSDPVPPDADPEADPDAGGGGLVL